MNIKDAKEEVKRTIISYLDKDSDGNYVVPVPRQRPVFLVGAPGIGKTTIMAQIAKELDIGLVSYTITHHTRQSAIGLPMISKRVYNGQEYSVSEYTMSEIIASVYECIERTGKKEGILFIDEINCVSETLAPAMLDLLQNKKFGPHYIPKGWVLVSAGNPSEFNKSVKEFDTVTLDRVKKIDATADYESWKEYAINNDVDGSILFYLSQKPDNLLSIQNTVDGTVFATPRGWEDLSIGIKQNKKFGFPTTIDFIKQFIQSNQIAKEYFSHYKIYLKYAKKFDCNKVLNGDFSYKDEFVKYEFDEKMANIQILCSAVIEQTKQNDSDTKKKIENALDFMELVTNGGPEMIYYLVTLLTNNNFIVFLAKDLSMKYINANNKYLAGKKKSTLLDEINKIGL